MKLILEHEEPLNTTYKDEEGNILYKAGSASGSVIGDFAVKRKITIQKAVKEGSSDLTAFAEIIFYASDGTPDRLRVKGQWEQDADAYFRKGKKLVFTGPDGAEYRWIVDDGKSQLFLNDESNTPVTTYNRKYYGIFHNKSPAFIDIQPNGEHMVDVIVLTYLYVEGLKQEKGDESLSGTMRLLNATAVHTYY